MSLEELRNKIDGLDENIIELIQQRIHTAEEIGQAKKSQKHLIEDKAREHQVLEHVKKLAQERGIKPADIEEIFKKIISTSRRVQGAEVVFQGEAGAYAEEAAFKFFGSDAIVKQRETLEDVFGRVETGEAQFGVVPIENSLEGSISRVYDLLLESPLKVCGETELRIAHCLIGNEDSTLDTIKKVYSHPQALAQSRNFLKHLNAELVSTYNTAASVRMVKDEGGKSSVAIASARAAEIYGMKIISREIEDNKNNFTRFFVLAGEDSPRSGNDKTSIVFSTKNLPGSLYQSLCEFASRKINLSKLESRPTRHKPWEYNFYLDFEGHRQDKIASEALKALEDSTVFVKVLGSYPRAK